MISLRQVFSTWKSQLEGVATSDKQIKQIQRYHGIAITQNVLSTSNPSDSEIDVAVYTMKKNFIAILHHSIQATQILSPDKNSRFDWHKECWPMKGMTACPRFFVELLHSTLITLSYTELKWVHQFSGLDSVPKA